MSFTTISYKIIRASLLLVGIALLTVACSSYGNRGYDPVYDDRGYDNRGPAGDYGHNDPGYSHYSDRELQNIVHAEIARTVYNSDIRVEVQDQVVYLSGYVADRTDFRRAHDISMNVPGVRSVVYDQLRLY